MEVADKDLNNYYKHAQGLKKKHEQNKERNRSYEEPDGILKLKI